MVQAQALDTPVWKLKLWWPKVSAKLMKAANADSEAFPRWEKKAVLEGVWNGICPDWFDVTDVEVGTPFIDGVSLLEICAEESTNLESILSCVSPMEWFEK
jgi:hypothetical protein